MVKVFILGQIKDVGYIDNFISSFDGYCKNLYSTYNISLYAFPQFLGGVLYSENNFALGCEGEVKDIGYVDNFISSTKSRLDSLCSKYDFIVDIQHVIKYPS